MVSIRSQLKKGLARLPWHAVLLPGESSVAGVGLALAAILLAAMGSAAWWVMRMEQSYLQQTRSEQLRTVAAMTVESAGVMLSTGELTALRRFLGDLQRNYQLQRCTVTLPDGQVVADGNPSRVTVEQLPENWPRAIPQEELHSDAQTVAFSYPLTVRGRGAARFYIAMSVDDGLAMWWRTQAGFGLIGAVALLLLLLVYRQMRKGFRSVSSICEVLRAVGAGETPESSLVLVEGIGPEVAGWNRLLEGNASLRKQLLEQRKHSVVSSRPQARPELEGAFDAMPQGLILIDERYIVKYINGAAAAFLQIKRKGATGTPVAQLLTEPKMADMVASITNGTLKRIQSIELSQSEEAGGGVMRFTARPVRREDKAAAMITIEDITQQRVGRRGAEHIRRADNTRVANTADKHPSLR